MRCLLLAVLLTAVASAQPSALQQHVQALADAHHGSVAVFAKNLATGDTIALNPDVPVQTASVIKLGILFTAMEQVRAGRVTLADPIILRKEDQVAGSGVLLLFDTPVTLTLHDILMLMITQSDNTATNLAIDRLGRAAIDDELIAMHLPDTWLYKQILKPATEPMPPDQKRFGLGKTTARQMAQLLERIDHCQFVAPVNHSSTSDLALCTDMMTLLQKQFYRDGIPRLLDTIDSSEVDASLGNKTGSLDAVRNDVGIISSKAGTILLSIFTWNNRDQSWSTDTEAQLTIARIAQAIVTTWSPQGLDPKDYRPHPAQ